jgi:TolB protein
MDSETGDAGGITLLTNNRYDDNDPAYSADGRKLAFESYASGSSEAYTMNADGTSMRRLTFRSQEEFQAAWSPDGTNIVFQAGAGADFDILKVKSDGSDRTGALLTVDPANDGRPNYSPDGTKIAIDSNGRIAGQSSDIFLMDPNLGDTAPLVNLTPTTPSQDRHPNYSPDGKKIVFQSNRDTVGPITRENNNLEIYTMNAADGSDVTRLTFNNANDPATAVNDASDSDPIWSPDGRKILFQSGRADGDTEVFTMNVDGSSVKRLTNNPGFDGRCDWQPIPRIAPVPPTYAIPGLPVTPPGSPSLTPIRPNMVRPSVSARQRGNQIIVRVRGRMVGVQGRSCVGRVKVGLRIANRRRGLRRVRMSSACRYKATLRSSVRGLPRRVRPRRRVLIARVTARFQGNSRLRTDLSPTRRARVRR